MEKNVFFLFFIIRNDVQKTFSNLIQGRKTKLNNLVTPVL